MKRPGRLISALAAGLAVQLLCAAAASASAIPDERRCAALAGQKAAQTISTVFQADAQSCQISGELRPVPGSRIGFQLWMPARWNGRLLMLGNGGYSSALPSGQMRAYLQRGYAVVATDTGHQGDDPDFAIGHPQAIDDWGWRAVHETTVAAKALVRRFYGRRARYSYFNGCSTGGHQGLIEAQRFPGDFNGIVAGAPGSNRTRLNLGFLWQYVSNHRPDGSLILAASKLRLLTGAALKACGGNDALAAGYLVSPFACRFDPAIIACAAGPNDACLSPEEVAAARRMYEGARDPRTGAQIYPPWLPGSESIGGQASPLPGWSLYWADPARPSQPMRVNFFRHWVFGDPAWQWASFDFSDLSRFEGLSRKIDATDPDLAAFKARGGKLIHYHGLADPVVSPWDSRNYFSAVSERVGSGTRDFYRLFFIPGMGHCGGGPGFSPVDPQEAMEAWVERQAAPAALNARLSTDSNNVALIPAE